MEQTRLRVTFCKGPEIKYISHLDLALTWERALRRGGIPLAYSQGYHPQPKLQLASGLPLGYTGSAEIMDTIVTEVMSPEEFINRVNPTLPQGLCITAVEEVPLKASSLQSALRLATYRITAETTLPEVEIARRIANLLASEQFIQQRVRQGRTETYDLRPLIDDVHLEAIDEEQAELWMRLKAGQHGNVRPDAILSALGLGQAQAKVERTQLLFEFDSS